MTKKNDIFGSAKAMHNYYCFCTHQYIQAQLIFVLMVREFKKKPEAGKAQLISKWFLEGSVRISVCEACSVSPTIGPATVSDG